MKVLFALILAAALGLASTARAQTCHATAVLPSDAPAVRMSLTAEHASYRTSRYEGAYQGFSILSGWSSNTVAFELGIPAYRLVRNGLPVSGLGDVWLNARAQLWRSVNGDLGLGTGLVVAAPTGDSSHDLGMGHWMLNPTVFGQWSGERLYSQLELGYGRALGSHSHSHSGGMAFPVVNPMNLSELGGKLSAGVHLTPTFGLRAGVDGFVPVFLAGVVRSTAFTAADVRWRSLEASVALHLPLAGAPYDFKLATAVGLAF